MHTSCGIGCAFERLPYYFMRHVMLWSFYIKSWRTERHNSLPKLGQAAMKSGLKKAILHTLHIQPWQSKKSNKTPTFQWSNRIGWCLSKLWNLHTWFSITSLPPWESSVPPVDLSLSKSLESFLLAPLVQKDWKRSVLEGSMEQCLRSCFVPLAGFSHSLLVSGTTQSVCGQYGYL